MILLYFVLLYGRNTFPVFVQLILLISNEITHFHLLFDQVFGLRERANELLSLLLFQLVHFFNMFNSDSSQILFLELQFNLFIAQLASQCPLLLVQMQENLNISVKLSFLLILDDFFDFSLFHHLLLFFFEYLEILLGHLYLYLILDVSELLSFLANVLLHSYFHFL